MPGPANYSVVCAGEKWNRALDIGSWNGWLANGLTKSGFEVIAVDYFLHDKDGLGARRYYDDASWTSIQMDLEDLTILGEDFDLIVVNRCFPYFTDTSNLIASVKSMLRQGGAIIVTGLNHSKKELFTNALERSAEKFEKNHTGPFKFKEFKGYIDGGDLKYLQSQGFKVRLYPNFRNRLKAIISQFGMSYYAYYIKDELRADR